MEVELRKAGNCVSQYNKLAEKTHKELIIRANGKGFLRSFVEICVWHLVCIGVIFDKKHAM
jgi:hypothetical protein